MDFTITPCQDCGITRFEQDLDPTTLVCANKAVCGEYGTGSFFQCDHCNDWRPIDEYNYHNGDRKCDDCLAEYLREYGDR